jgi:hypothetical protein
MNQLRGFYGAGPIFTRSRECSSCAWRDGDLCACRPVQKFIQVAGRVNDVSCGRAPLQIARWYCGGLYYVRRRR